VPGKNPGRAKKGGKKDLQICEAGTKSRKRPTLVGGKNQMGNPDLHGSSFK
jgi:hypothetical protein